ncbi:MAG: hypothetical protein IJC98_02730 [Clostridia bacterium]|nr:hypothetical protein [Clostridia bacterium]
MIILENQYIRVSFSERGRITSIINKSCNNTEIIDSPSPRSFFMNLANDVCRETLVLEERQTITASEKDGVASFHMDHLVYDNGKYHDNCADISLTLHATLENDSILFYADIDNKTDFYIFDFEYPNVGIIKSLGNGKPTLYWPDEPGRLYMNIGETLSSEYHHREHGANTMQTAYPGRTMLGTFGIMDRETSLFLATEDPEFIACQLKVIGDHKNNGSIMLTVDKHLCYQNTCARTAPVRVRLYKGDWKRAAREYAEWVTPYCPKHDVPTWIREMKGYFLVINKQQFGYEAWSYDTLPQLHEIAKSHGFDTLGLFGWYHSGHDGNYPDIEVSDTLGGEKMLKENIKAVQNAGGHVSLYFQGHLIDIQSDFYKNGIGKDVAAVNMWGAHYIEFWPKSHYSSMLNYYSDKSFTIACFATPQWRNLLTEKQAWIASLGADASLYDQLGGTTPYICFNKDHPHEGNNPARATSNGQRMAAIELQKQSKENSENFAFMSELFTDIFSTNMDAVHSVCFYPGSQEQNKYRIGDEAGGEIIFPELVRYAFPNVVITGRNGAPFCLRRYTNFTFLYNLIPEMEVRYKADRDDVLADTFKEDRIYSAEMSAFRDKYRKKMAYSTFTDTDGIHNDNLDLIVKGYRYEDELFVTFWNDSDKAHTPNIQVDGKELVSFEVMNGSSDTKLLEIPAQSVAIAIYR